jgi:rhamnosyltransferase
MGEKLPLISIIIPVKNGESWLQKTMTAIFSQQLIQQTEVIAIDSGSTDQSIQILQRFPVQIIHIDPREFNHGQTRNVGVQAAKGKFVVMTVQDAEPADENWLAQLLDGFDDENVAGVCGTQIVPHDQDKNPVKWWKPQSLPVKRKFFFENYNQFAALTPEKKREICSWDDVNAMYRREVLLKVPFQTVSFAEDVLWARDAILAGHSIVYNPHAKVKHYHYETADSVFRRSFTISYHFYIFFGVLPSTDQNQLITLLRIIKILVFENKIQLLDKWKWLVYNYRLNKAMNYSHRVFLSAQQKGLDELNRKHHKICGNIPQALRPF